MKSKWVRIAVVLSLTAAALFALYRFIMNTEFVTGIREEIRAGVAEMKSMAHDMNALREELMKIEGVDAIGVGFGSSTEAGNTTEYMSLSIAVSEGYVSESVILDVVKRMFAFYPESRSRDAIEIIMGGGEMDLGLVKHSACRYNQQVAI